MMKIEVDLLSLPSFSSLFIILSSVLRRLSSRSSCHRPKSILPKRYRPNRFILGMRHLSIAPIYSTSSIPACSIRTNVSTPVNLYVIFVLSLSKIPIWSVDSNAIHVQDVRAIVLVERSVRFRFSLESTGWSRSAGDIRTIVQCGREIVQSTCRVSRQDDVDRGQRFLDVVNRA